MVAQAPQEIPSFFPEIHVAGNIPAPDYLEKQPDPVAIIFRF